MSLLNVIKLDKYDMKMHLKSYGFRLYLVIRLKRMFVASPPVWKNETEIRDWMINPVRITIGGALLLKCPAKGNPLPHITWLRDGKALERGINMEMKRDYWLLSIINIMSQIFIISYFLKA